VAANRPDIKSITEKRFFISRDLSPAIDRPASRTRSVPSGKNPSPFGLVQGELHKRLSCVIIAETNRRIR
jgi:hypothetical protein